MAERRTELMTTAAHDLESGQWITASALGPDPVKVLAIARTVPGVCRLTLFSPTTGKRSAFIVPLSHEIQRLPKQLRASS